MLLFVNIIYRLFLEFPIITNFILIINKLSQPYP